MSMDMASTTLGGKHTKKSPPLEPEEAELLDDCGCLSVCGCWWSLGEDGRLAGRGSAGAPQWCGASVKLMGYIS